MLLCCCSAGHKITIRIILGLSQCQTGGTSPLVTSGWPCQCHRRVPGSGPAVFLPEEQTVSGVGVCVLERIGAGVVQALLQLRLGHCSGSQEGLVQGWGISWTELTPAFHLLSLLPPVRHRRAAAPAHAVPAPESHRPGRAMGKAWESHGKGMGKLWKSHG